MKKKILIISGHFSTGGAPQVTLNKIKLLKDTYIIKCVEYNFLGSAFVIQRNQVEELLKSNFHSLGDNKHELIDIINEFNPDVISMEEFPEFFMDDSISNIIYRSDRPYTILETTHDSSFPVTSKRLFPDKFIFVSAFNGFRYSVYDIPYEIVEYPVDYKKSDKLKNQMLLGLDPTYKHILNVGLFTERKNQSYIFDIAKKLEEYKILFHFIGNQADNFKNYWKPLLENKPSNCVIWGERKDVPSFIEASDLFLFPSKGDKDNKELNPIALKEALEFKIPMLMYNLDVYCGKYDNYTNIKFLTGDIDKDIDKLLEIIKPVKKDSKVLNTNKDEELIIIGTYPNTKSRNKLTLDCIESLKSLGRKIMIVSHYPVSEEIQRSVDYYVFDANNPVTEHSFYSKFYNYVDNFDVEININGLKNTNQSFPVLTNLINGFKSAKSLGFEKVFYITYDVIVKQEDNSIIEDMFLRLNDKDGYLCTLNGDLGLGIETTSMGFRTDYFLSIFKEVNTIQKYNNDCAVLNCQNFLEDYMYKKLCNEKTLEIFNNDEQTMLINSGKGVSSHSEYYSLLPVLESENKVMFYFYTYNIDNRSVEIKIKEEGQVIYISKFDILTTREFKKEFDFNGSEIEVELSFYEDNEIYKNEKFLINSDNISELNKNGWFKYKRIPKIKLVHIQTTRNEESEVLSRESIQRVSDYGIEYVLQQNDVYSSLPPAHTCIRPNNVRMTKYPDNDPEFGHAITPPHYGCYDSWKTATLSEFDKDLDFIIVCEGDCIIEVPIEEFVSKVYEACEIVKNENISYFSFGDTKVLDMGWHQSDVIREIPNQDLLFITNKIIGTQCIMFPIKEREYLLNSFRTKKWDCIDSYFNIIFEHKNIGILKNRLTTQASGYSFVDQEYRKF
jgi:hypothetical protein